MEHAINSDSADEALLADVAAPARGLAKLRQASVPLNRVGFSLLIAVCFSGGSIYAFAAFATALKGALSWDLTQLNTAGGVHRLWVQGGAGSNETSLAASVLPRCHRLA